jgi:hypothetical protein
MLILFWFRTARLPGSRQRRNVRRVAKLGTELAVQGVTPVLKQTFEAVFSFPLRLYVRSVAREVVLCTTKNSPTQTDCRETGAASG